MYTSFRGLFKQAGGRFLFSVVAFAFIAVVAASCSKSSSGDNAAGATSASASDAGAEYRLIKTELKLAEAEKPYLVMNMRRKWVEIRLKGVIVWEYPFDLMDTDEGELNDYTSDFLGDKNTLVRPILEKHLFAAQSMTPDSVLEIISEATRVDAELLQRELPSRFQILWAGGITLDIRTDVEGKPKSKFDNTIADLRQAITRPLGRSILIMKMPKEAALTLYRASLPGLPTLIIPA